LNSPSDKSVNVAINPTLKWGIQGSSNELRYQYQMATDTSFSGSIIKTVPLDDPSEAVASCIYATTYYWRGRAYHSKDTSRWSPVWQFTTLPKPTLPKVVLYSPVNGAINVPLPSVDLIWYTVSGAESYDIEVALDPAFDQVLVSGNTPNFGVVFSGMAAGRIYYWRVKAKSSLLEGPWSSTSAFKTAGQTGVDDINSNLTFVLIYPNPVSNVLHVKCDGLNRLIIYNISGKKVHDSQIFGNETEVNTTSYSDGIYYVETHSNYGVSRDKIIIKK
jgi:hypothetical protein